MVFPDSPFFSTFPCQQRFFFFFAYRLVEGLQDSLRRRSVGWFRCSLFPTAASIPKFHGAFFQCRVLSCFYAITFAAHLHLSGLRAVVDRSLGAYLLVLFFGVLFLVYHQRLSLHNPSVCGAHPPPPPPPLLTVFFPSTRARFSFLVRTSWHKL